MKAEVSAEHVHRSIVLEKLEEIRQASNAPICVCAVYFRYSDRVEMTVRDVLEILVKQTLERHPECRESVSRVYSLHLREGTLPPEPQLLGLLRHLNASMSITFYVLDALDEAPVRLQRAIVKALDSLSAKLFITSRPLEDLQSDFPHASTFRIAAHDRDIDLYIEEKVEGSVTLRNLLRRAGPSFREEIVAIIKSKCGGMYGASFLHSNSYKA